MCKVIEESGMRGIISFSMKDKDIPNFPYSRGLKDGVTTESVIKEAENFHSKWDKKANGRLRVSYATNIWSTSDELYIHTKELADKHHTSIHDHLDQHRHELEYSLRTWKKRPVEHLEDLGVLGPNFNAHHMVYVGDREIPILQKHSVNICHNPRAALNSHGIPKFPLFNAMGLTCTLGTDMRISDMFEVMRLASYVHHGTWGLYYYDPLVLPAEDILEMVTLNPAKAAGMSKTFGSIEKGKKADITIVDVKKPHLSPSYDIIAELTRFTYGSDVDTVIVDGEILMENRKVLTMNESEIVEKAIEIGKTRYNAVKDKIPKMVPVNRWKII
jgi:5-methylthioadenosine/S-adenosylhomocysteine deaminase